MSIVKRTMMLLAVAFMFGARAAFGALVPPNQDYLWLDMDEQMYDVGDYVDVQLGVASGADVASISCSGLPSGVKFDNKKGVFSGRPTKAGVYYSTVTAKNKNGFSHSMVVCWTIGYADNGNYDNIGIDWENLWNGKTGGLVEWQTGENVSFSLLSAFENDDLYPATVSGLPPSLSVPKCPANLACGYPPGSYVGMLTKAGKYKVTVTAKYWGGGSQTWKAVKTIIVKDSGCRYLNVVSPNPGRGTVTGSKVYAVGAKASISAKAAKGYFFAGWYRDAEFSEPLEDTASGDWRKASDSIIVTGDIADSGIFAKFVSSYEDDIDIYCGETWDVATSYSDIFYVDVSSETIPTVTVKGLPPGITWNKSYFALESTPSKLKPGTAVATITAKNLSGRTATKTVRIAVPNIESWVFDGIDYSPDAYRLTVGVSDMCVPAWFSFGYDTSFRVSVAGLPPGLKYRAEDGLIAFRGTPTKVGTYTVTLTAKAGSYTEKATFTVTVDPLPDYAIGTFNGILKDDYGEVVGSFTFTAAANGKQSVKVTTTMGTMSLSASAWNCFDGDGRPEAYFYKSTNNEYVSFMLTPSEDADWNCEHQLEGNLWWGKGGMELDAYVNSAQRNPFAKVGTSYEHPEAAFVAESLASEYKSMNMAILWDSDLGAYTLVCANCCMDGSMNDGTATLKMNKNGTVTVSGKLYGLYSFSATATLTFDTSCGDHKPYAIGCTLVSNEHCYAVFTPVVKMKVCAHSVSSSSVTCMTENQLEAIYWLPLGN